jgi:branched-chain amino acid transport system substrate-binding protein
MTAVVVWLVVTALAGVTVALAVRGRISWPAAMPGTTQAALGSPSGGTGGRATGPPTSPPSQPRSTPVASASSRPAPSPTPTPPSRPPTVRIGITLPLSGPELAGTASIRDAVEMAVEEAQLGGYLVDTVVLDHSVNGYHDAAQGAADMQDLVDDPDVVAVVGPYNSSVAAAQIPISNAAGLVQCSPSTTYTSLTLGPRALALRPTYPETNSFIRVSVPEDLEGAGMARFARTQLGLERVAVVDDMSTYGTGVADRFAAELKRLGGKVTRYAMASGDTDLGSLAGAIKAARPGGIMFAGETGADGAALRRALAAHHLGSLPFLGDDGIVDGDGRLAGSYIRSAGKQARGTYGAVAAINTFPGQPAFVRRFARRFGYQPGAYAGPGYACAQVLLQAMRDAAAHGAVTRDTVRRAVTDPNATFGTVLGQMTFDAGGDTSLRIISIYRVDPRLAGGAGDWRFQRQITLDPP